MSEMKAVGSFDKTKGTLTIVLDLAGHSPIEHEMLAAAFDAKSSVVHVIEKNSAGEVTRGVQIHPDHDGDQLSATIEIFDPGLWDRAVRAETNRQRIANGQPTLDQEEADAEARKQAEANAQAAQEDAAAKAKADAEAAAEKVKADAEAHDHALAATVAAATVNALKDAGVVPNPEAPSDPAKS